MEIKEMIYRIKSKYILKFILLYIKDENFQPKLFLYSKYFQNRLDINLLYYFKKFLSNLGFDVNKYLYIEEEKYKKDILTKEYNDFILKNKLDKETFEKIIYKTINNQINTEKKK